MNQESRITRALPIMMVLLSGFAGLVYQVLWMRQLGLLFGNTAHAAAATLAVFFAGLAGGSWFWGRRVSAASNPLRTYARLEAGIAVTALVYFWVMALFRLVYPAVYQGIGSGVVLLMIKCVLAMVLVFPPAFCMGGTLPVMGQYLIVRQELFGATTAKLYGINTIGAALGAFMAAFWCIPHLGFNATCVFAMVVTGSIAATAYGVSRGMTGQEAEAETETPAVSRAAARRERRGRSHRKPQDQPVLAAMGRPTIRTLAFISGFSVLALEVLWTRMFAQIHENSVYSFAAVLIIVLVCLSLGALLAGLLARVKVAARPLLSVLMIASGVVLSLLPVCFVGLTRNLTMLPTDGTFASYVIGLFGRGFVVMGPACLLMGMVFPFLMKSEERYASQPGRSIGYLSAINTVGAILGSLLCGFLFLRLLGMWWTVQAIAALYLLAGIVLPERSHVGSGLLRAVGTIGLLLLFTALNPSGLPVVGADPRRGPETVVEVWETSDCTVSVVQDGYGERTIKVNSNYGLGSTGAIPQQAFQARIPLFIYPETERIFFLGLGTGITAGASLDREMFKSVQHIVVCELVPEVITAARRYMGGGVDGNDYTHGLFTDARAELLVEDGRHFLMATDSTFDMINADLFLPYRSGAGSLYSREHFEQAKARLNPGGVFVQWLPLYQLTAYEFGVIGRTMLSVFDQVTLWRNNFQPGSEIVALIGHCDATPLPVCDLPIGADKRAAVAGKSWLDLQRLLLPCNEQSVLLFYCGNVTAASERFDAYPVNTDDKPVIEYMAPRSLRKASRDLPAAFVGPRLAELVDALQRECPPARDPMLANRTAENRRLPVAGAALHHAWIDYAMNRPEACREAWGRFVREWTDHGGEGM